MGGNVSGSGESLMRWRGMVSIVSEICGRMVLMLNRSSSDCVDKAGDDMILSMVLDRF